MPRTKPKDTVLPATHARHESTISLPDGLNTPAALSHAQAHASASAERTTASLNLRVLQRYNPSITTILAVAPFATVYDFSASGAWEKTGVEGTLFVVALAPQSDPDDIALFHATGVSVEPPLRFAALVLNRKGLDNFSAALSGADAVDVADDFIMITETEEGVAPTIHGLWVFSDGGAEDARAVAATVMRECAEVATRSAVAAEQQRDQARGTDQQGGLGGRESAAAPQHTGWMGGGQMQAPPDQQRFFADQGYAHDYQQGYEQQLQYGYAQPPAQSQGQADVLGSLFARARLGIGQSQL